MARELGAGHSRLGLTSTELEALVTELALAHYKDEAGPALDWLERGLEILSPHLATSTNPELLGVAAAIEKRLYRWDSQRGHLTRGIAHAERGHEADAGAGWPRQGYPGINAAFMLDLLAADGGPSPESAGATARADAIRRDLLAAEAQLRPNQHAYFAVVTLAEAALGLGSYARAGELLHEAAKMTMEPWERETTGRQLAMLLRLRAAGPEVDPEGVEALRKLFPDDSADALLGDALRGKLGLALSGGGFRASFYHLGVLRKLAETDVLRHVEVLSCVSGGSIVGMQYYLELKRAIEGQAGDLAQKDYVELVDRVTDRFEKAVANNIRLRVLFNPLENIAMLRGKRSRTARAGALYERYFYQARGCAVNGRCAMSDLSIVPKGRKSFDPVRENWSRRSKVPVLVINATSLNTAHPWQFTASEMGEPLPTRAASEADVGDRYVRTPYAAFESASHQAVPIGDAVGASACVPGIFEPLALQGAYPGGATIRLVDGGVYDNQGAAALLERDCVSLIVSDASGQMSSATQPSGGVPGVLARSDAVLQTRVRETLYANLKSRQRGRLLKTVSFLHLKSGVTPTVYRPGKAAEPPTSDVPLPYEITRAIQERLAELRTDLDAFSSLESTLLMASGYKMAAKYVHAKDLDITDRGKGTLSAPTWLAAAEKIFARTDLENARVLELLEIGSSVFGKAWRVRRWTRAAGRALALLAVVLLGSYVYHQWSAPLTSVTIGVASLAAGGYLLPKLLPWTEPWVDGVLGWRDRPRLWLTAFGLAAVAWFSVYVGDRIYLRAGDEALKGTGKGPGLTLAESPSRRSSSHT